MYRYNLQHNTSHYNVTKMMTNREGVILNIWKINIENEPAGLLLSEPKTILHNIRITWQFCPISSQERKVYVQNENNKFWTDYLIYTANPLLIFQAVTGTSGRTGSSIPTTPMSVKPEIT